MVRRAAVLSLFWLALAGCGGAAGGRTAIGLTLSGATGADHYDIRVFGAAVHCGDILANPSQFELNTVCQASEVNTSTNCVLAHEIFSTGGSADHLENVSAGNRSVFVEAITGGSVTGHGCAALAVKAGTTTSVQVTVK